MLLTVGGVEIAWFRALSSSLSDQQPHFSALRYKTIASWALYDACEYGFPMRRLYKLLGCPVCPRENTIIKSCDKGGRHIKNTSEYIVNILKEIDLGMVCCLLVEEGDIVVQKGLR